MEPIDREIEKAAKKQKIFHKTALEQVDKLIQQLEQSRNILSSESSVNTAASNILPMLQKKITEANNEIQNDVKEYYNSLGKLSKLLEKKFPQNLDLAGNGDAFRGKEQSLQEAIALHFIREGQFELAETFCAESKTILSDDIKSKFSEMYNILSFLKLKNLAPALEWARKNRLKLEKLGSHLEFQLHQLQFLILLSPTNDKNKSSFESVGIANALQYAKKEFGIFGDKYLKEIQRLMCSVVYSTPNPLQMFTRKIKEVSVSPLLQSPYSDLISTDMWTDIENHFVRDFCTLLGLAQESPLSVVVNVGCNAIPTMIKLKSVLEDRKKVEIWSANDELPVEIPLGKKDRYHSVFVCPVSRDRTTDFNPPMMLTCGHVISKESLLRLSKGPKGAGANSTQAIVNFLNNSSTIPSASQSSTTASASMQIGGGSSAPDPMSGINPTSKIKCPYCPNESLSGHSLPISF